jgi:aminopeptidase
MKRILILLFCLPLFFSFCNKSGSRDKKNNTMSNQESTSGNKDVVKHDVVLNDQLIKNAKTILEISCLGKPGESVLILTDRDPVRMLCSRALEVAALDLGLVPVIMDVTAYGELGIEKARRDPLVGVMTSIVVEPVIKAVESADIVIRSMGMGLYYTTILGDPNADDIFISGKDRRMQLQTLDMDKWNISTEEVAIIRRRTMWLSDKLHSVKKVRVTSAAGTDFSVGLGKGATWYPVLGIIPLYGEVAIIPQLGPDTEGILVVDGSTQRGVRPPAETDRPPLRIVAKNGHVQDISGDPEQVARLKKLITNSNSSEVTIDELGIVTTSIKDNDAFWLDRYKCGTHKHNSIHIAPGNNVKRGEVVHGILHMDCDVLRPTVYLDDLVIMRDGLFIDSVIGQ